MTIKGIDLTPLLNAILPTVISLITAAGLWLSKKIADKFAADTHKTKAEMAAEKVALLVESMVQRTWASLAPEIQLALADGRVTMEERKHIEAKVRELLVDFTSQDDLEALAKALGVPFAGLIAMIAEKIIRLFLAAQDPDDPKSAFAFAPTSERPA